MKFRFEVKPFLLFLLIFFTEIFIALFINDAIIRPYGGDVLVVIMIYYFLKAFIRTKAEYLMAGTLLFAYAVETAQYFRMVEILGVQDNKFLVVVLGSAFDWGDMICYTLGIGICYLIEKRKQIFS